MPENMPMSTREVTDFYSRRPQDGHLKLPRFDGHLNRSAMFRAEVFNDQVAEVKEFKEFE
jgi:hypothetical protein